MSSQAFTILTLVAQDDTGDSRYRFEWPPKSISKKRPDWRIINLSATAKERLSWSLEADLLILIQPGDSDLLPIVRERKLLGLPTIVEFNDHFYEPPAWSPAAPHWSSPLLWETYEKFITLADILMTTSKGLKNLFQNKTNAPQVIIPNLFFHPIPNLDGLTKRKTTNPSVGWAGSLGHMADLLALNPILSSLSKDNEIHAMGNKAIPNLLNIQNLKFTEWSSIENYYSFWDPIWFGIVSLKDTPYNRCRSDIKPLELLSRGVIPIVQHSRTYESLIDKLGLPNFKSLDEIPTIISRLIKDKSKQDEIRTKGYEYVTKHRTEDTNNERLELYEGALKDKTPRSFPSSIKSGYHEISGTYHPATHTEVLAQYAKSESGLTDNFYVEYLKKCPDSADARIIYLNFLQTTKSGKLKEELKNASTDFPADLRFKLFAHELLPKSDKINNALIILNEIKDEKRLVVLFWKDHLIRHFLPINNFEVSKSLLELFPYDVSVLHQVAELSRISGDYDAAHEYFQRLLSLKNNFDPAIQNLDRAYLAAMSEGTKCE